MKGLGFEFRILGPVEVLHHGNRLTIRAAKLRTLLAALLLDANRVVTVETLIERVWGDDAPNGARNTLQNYVLRLRRLLNGAGWECPLTTHPRGYAIELPADTLDLHRFDALVRRARAAAAVEETEQAATLLREALRLWRGEALADIGSEVIRRDVVPVLDERRLDALELRIEADLALGRHEDVLAELHGLTTAHPLRERLWRQRMLALYRSGRRGESLRCYHNARDALVEQLGVDPGDELRELHRRLLTASPALAYVSPPRVRGNLPAEVTTFIGRARQLADIGRLVRGNRLVTLTGAGGVGKTRLALRAAAELSGDFPDGVWLADLTALPEGRPLEHLVVQALRIRDQSARPPADVLADFLRDRRLLLVLDNCEHVAAAVGALADTLLRAAPGLRMLTTSRHRLGLRHEHVLVVPPLTLPPVAAASRERPLTGYDAVALLVTRAAAAAPDFRVTHDNHDLVVQLCRRLDGIPLAIELAAVRLGTLSIAEILERLDDCFRPLGGDIRAMPRYHRTLWDVIDWSHELCTEPERLLWARLSVFSSGFDLEAAEAVCSGSGIARRDVVDLLASLCHKSVLLARTQGLRTRYRLLETIRQYGGRRLADMGAEARLRRLHRDHYQRLVATAAAEWCGVREVEWLSRLRRELPNLRTALDFCVTEPGQADNGLEIAVNLTRVRSWFFTSTIGEGRHWLERTCALSAPGPRRTDALAMLSWVALLQGDHRLAERYLAEHRAPASPVATYLEGAHAMLTHSDAGAIPVLARARDMFRRAGARGDAHMATMLWAMACAFLGVPDVARAAGDAYLEEAEANGAAWAQSWALWTLGLTRLRLGDTVAAIELLRDSLVRQRDIDDRWGPVWGAEALAWAVAAAGQYHRAAELLGAARHLRQAVGVGLITLRPFHEMHIEAVRLVRGNLDARSYAAALERGARTEDASPWPSCLVEALERHGVVHTSSESGATR
ncbi:BTAD domain-containing putative transcriptional regulator [Streptosporangium sp. NPDC000239]|uniref:AfsR/SARP family transcriptional regulator n=1 Tax=Streptosporangium sp. NPDC000239 TaxID=3154248 RepID=UPI00332AEDBB